jgi:hypothetical protein
MDPVFTGKFLKPLESFALQYFDATHLYRLSSDVLFWIVAITVVGLAIHFLASSVSALRRSRQAQS